MADTLMFVYSARAGEFSYYPKNAKLARGHVEVFHDSKRYVYDTRPVSIRTKREIRDDINERFAARAAKCTISGAYPSYFVETEN